MAILKSLTTGVGLVYNTTNTWSTVFSITGKGYLKGFLNTLIIYPNTGSFHLSKVRITIDGVAAIITDGNLIMALAKSSFGTSFYLDLEFSQSLKIEFINDFYSYSTVSVNVECPIVLL